VAVRTDGEFLYRTASARRFWAGVAAARKTTGQRGLCLVCGCIGDMLKTMPRQLPARLVPQATQASALVSINKATHGFDLCEELVHTPICASCGLSAMSALESLLDDQWKSAITSQNSRLAWWVTDDVPFSLEGLDDPDPEQVAHLLASPLRGRPAAGVDDGQWPMFCGLVIGGNVSRIVVREWIELPLPRIQENLRAWFDDHQIVDFWTGDLRYVGITRMTTVAGRWIRGIGGGAGSYARFGTPGSDRPDGLHRALLRSALLAKPLPPRLLAHLVHRIRTDGRLDAERAALLRLALRRRPELPLSDREAYMPTLNPADRKPAYLAGRTFAVLEDIQLSAAYASGEDPPNVTFTDRYFSRAVISPAVALTAGQRVAPAWLKRLRRARPDWAERAKILLTDRFDELAQAGGIPHGTVLADQTAFILGYHQERAALRAKRSARNASGQDPTTNDEGAPE